MNMSDLLNAKVSEILKCGYCKNYMYSEIWDCKIGHSICEMCYINRNLCPRCNGVFNSFRNLNLEAVRNVLHLPCPNSRMGCPDLFLPNELQDHLVMCDYRSYTCLLCEDWKHRTRRWKWKGCREALRSHCLTGHPGLVLNGFQHVCHYEFKTTPCLITMLILAFGEQFYLHVYEANGILTWALQYIGRTEDIILYCFQIKVFTEQYKNRKLVFNEICQSDEADSILDVVDTGFCVSVPRHVLETYRAPGPVGSISYEIKIQKA